jgi:hypothetical protein
MSASEGPSPKRRWQSSPQGSAAADGPREVGQIAANSPLKIPSRPKPPAHVMLGLQSFIVRPSSLSILQAVVSVQILLISMLRLNAASRIGAFIVRMGSHPPGPTYLAKHGPIKGLILELRNKSILHQIYDPNELAHVDAEISQWWNAVQHLIYPIDSELDFNPQSAQEPRSSVQLNPTHKLLLVVQKQNRSFCFTTLLSLLVTTLLPSRQQRKNVSVFQKRSSGTFIDSSPVI